MIWHPILLAAMAADLLGAFLYGAAALTALRIALNWSAASADRRQLELEVRSEGAVIQARWALAMFAFSFTLLLIGISNIFADLIPGAMCGTGVVQAMGTNAAAALIFRCLLLGALLFWNTLERLDQRRPDHPLARFNARVLLAIAPLLFLALLHTYRAVLNVDVQLPVDCCAVVYDQFRSLDDARRPAGIPDRYWLGAFGGLSVVMLVYALRLRLSSFLRGGVGLVGATILWVLVASVTLVNILSAYHYHVLQHHCPWCLFLPDHHLVGYPLFAALAVVVFESALAAVLPRLAARHPLLQPDLRRRNRQAGGRLLMALLLFVCLSVLPAVIWRLRFGTWMG
jgi:hypothetical protein